MTRIGHCFKHKRDVLKGQNRRVVTYKNDRPRSFMVRDDQHDETHCPKLNLNKETGTIEIRILEIFINLSHLFDLQMTSNDPQMTANDHETPN